VDPGSTSVHVTVCESSTSLQIKKFGDPVDNVTRFWKLSPNGVSSPKPDVITPAVVVDVFALAATVSVPIEKVETKLVPDCDIVAPAVTVSSPTLAAKDEPDINGDPTFWTPPPLTEATANSAIDPCPSGIYPPCLL
jgi:hypothetical protein|tara:strand:- start:286 stop:696 length:411 start_codon:yes stop_codon:yes gene_type:complete